jgi:hypothetical protein
MIVLTNTIKKAALVRGLFCCRVVVSDVGQIRSFVGTDRGISWRVAHLSIFVRSAMIHVRANSQFDRYDISSW